MSAQQLWLVRHGETEWSVTGQHTGRSDIPLTDAGEAAARALGVRVGGHRFARVLTSPRQRARRTAELAECAGRVEVTDDLMEWDYGDYEGITTKEIRKTVPGWTIWSHGAPNGETAEQVAARVDRVIESVRSGDGDVVAFAHGHVLRVLAARWLGCPPEYGRMFALATAAVCVLGYERENPVVVLWNDSAHATQQH